MVAFTTGTEPATRSRHRRAKFFLTPPSPPDFALFLAAPLPAAWALSAPRLTADTPGAESTILGLLTLAATRAQYEGGTADATLVAPEGWLLDQHFLDQPGRKQAQLALAYDYRSNLAACPDWQARLREHRPPTPTTWGTGDPLFTEPGARAYLRDVPEPNSTSSPPATSPWRTTFPKSPR